MRPAPSLPVVHLELHTGSLARARDLYADLCGWRAERIDTPDGCYQALDLGPDLGGGIVECPTRRSLWLPYVEVADVAEATHRARRVGASVLLAPREGPAGWRSVIATRDGAELAFWQRKR
jgi:predicted enzyme related to lactoylglutathione lyase